MIHPTAIIDPAAQLDSSVTVGPYSVIGPEVEIGADTKIEAHVVIKGPTTIGRENHIYQFSSIGDAPQDKKYHDEATSLIVGDRNTIREYCTLNRGTTLDNGTTRIGSDNWIMAYCHVAHDCVVGDHTIFANNASIAGHVWVGDHVILGGFTSVHQFCHIGAHAFTSMFTYVTKDIPAFVVAAGRPGSPRGINSEGLRRRGYSASAIGNLKDAYKVIYRKGLRLEEAIEELNGRVTDQTELQPLVTSLRVGTRGLMR